MAKNRVIGRDGTLPWRLPEDLKRFKRLTMGHHIVMGRKTWESLGRLLAGRHHVIVSRRPGYSVSGATVVDSIDASIAAARDDSEVFVIGGGEIYALALPNTDRIYITEVDSYFEGDTFFPELDPVTWKETERAPKIDENSAQRYSFVTLDRVARR